MPIYEYTCKKCSHIHDAMRTIASRDEPIECPECGSMECSRNITHALGAVDTTLTPDKATSGQFSQLMDKMKRGHPESAHSSLDRASSRNGGLWGNN